VGRPSRRRADDWVKEVIASAGEVGVGLLVLLENIFPPIPSEVILPLAGFGVSRGVLSFAGVVVAATLGSLAGALILYALARGGGRLLILRLGSVLRVDPQTLDRAEERFDRHAVLAVLGGRLVPGLRSVVSVPAGLVRCRSCGSPC
jgi:membrane protein DedA with SNARE-associated domain